MRYDSDEKLDHLFATARCDRIETTDLEAHFETRIMAHIAEKKIRSKPWHGLVWRMIPGFMLIAAISVLCNLTFIKPSNNDLFASIANVQEESGYTDFLSGE